MSLKLANQLFQEGKYQQALVEYQKVKSDHPLYQHAQFNINLIHVKLHQDIIPTNSISKLESNEQPLVSVVMPVFNVAPYLDASIMSVLNQSYTNIELIIVNDASTDNGLNIINMYKNWDSRIKVVNLEFNTMGGAGIPSNIGVDNARGEYLAYADSDDILDKYAIQKMMESALKHEAEVIIADFSNFNNEIRVIENGYDKKNWNNIPLDEVFSPKDKSEIFRLSPVPWRKLYKVSFLNNNKIRFPEGDYFYEDNPLHWFVLTKAKRVVLLDYVVAYHRMEREGQTMGAMNFKLSAQFCHLNSIKNHLLKMKDVPRIYWKELVDFAYRGGWVVDRQDIPEFQSIVKKRYAQTALGIEKLSHIPKDEIRKMRPNFYKRCEEYNQAYADLDLSIVVPVYNCVDLLPQLMESLLKVNLKTDIFLIDDGSKDGSRELCEKYAKQYKNVYCIAQANKGAGVARNLVIPLLTGEYSYFVDADDFIDPKSLEESVKFAQKNNHDLVLFKYKIEFHEKGNTRDMWDADKKIWAKLLVAKNNNERKILASQLINYPWNRAVKTSLLHDENIFFGKTVVHNDVPYHWHTVVSANNIGIYDKPVCTHRKFEERQQITNISDYRRLMVLEAYRHTHELLKRYDSYALIFPHWQKFIRDLLTWARDRVPEDKLEFYKERHKQILDELKGVNL
ncbi:glycosyltransferase [Actinobacillus pleuropneumoniae]|uniref:Capsular polysaccharide biosynthesis protein Cps16C n=1 Tax=Actinobacillus pleuropneumoniae TaxID=715 RepID=A0A1P8J7S2_ACTPL|nr:glycosyltransferase [Actinobacillus pleuropneumoniae]APW29088.1 capsular polysaccharide biosynthesis protein Cps16C [Actinobacillus pleuropneumoniae]AVY03748.1 capsular polysaccharide biosynthesis protein Cps16C [Actinobacillus pleuropneumoniae]UKH20697.1 glycosyltransferase [Actinobacillus pleuropneumoniae]UPA20442.1 glycosyltransferase [Actinobacillus pleuropneumoniae]